MAQLVQAAGELAPRRGRSACDDLYELTQWVPLGEIRWGGLC